jgi:MFS family permease
MGFVGYVAATVGAALVVVFGFGLVQAIIVGFGYRFGGSPPHPQLAVLLSREWFRRTDQFGLPLGIAAAIAYAVASSFVSDQLGWQAVVGLLAALPLVWIGATVASVGVVAVHAILALRRIARGVRDRLPGTGRRTVQRRRELAALADRPAQGKPSNGSTRDEGFVTAATFQPVSKGVSGRQVDRALVRMHYVSANLSLLYSGHPVLGVYSDIRFLRGLGRNRWRRAWFGSGYDPEQVRLSMAGFSLLAYELERLQIACHLLSDAVDSGVAVPPQDDERPVWLAWTTAPFRGDAPSSWGADADDLYWPPSLSHHHEGSPMGGS